MHVRDLVELAARIAVSAAHAESTSTADPRGRSIQTYWSAARCRSDRWTRAIRLQGELLALGQINSREAWRHFQPLFQEILASELVTRVTAAAAAVHDARQKQAEFEPVARSVFTAHLEVRAKVLQLLLTGDRQGVPAARELNDLRRRVERWTDLLLAHLGNAVCVHDFAFEPNRTADFADDLHSGGTAEEQELAGELLFSSFRGSLLSHLTAASPNADLNQTIGRSIAALFGDSAVESGDTGWLARISRMTDEAQEMLDEIESMEVR
jgi:hypothetical protein